MTSSLRQVPEFWQAPDYGVELRRHITPLFHLLVRAQHWLNELVAILFVLLCAGAAAARLLLRRRGWMTREHGVIAATVFVGIIPACFLAYGDTGRYGYVYLPLVVVIGFSVASRMVGELAGRYVYGTHAEAAARGAPRPMTTRC